MKDMYDESYNNPYHFNRRSKVSAYQQKLKDRNNNNWILQNMFGKENQQSRNISAPNFNQNFQNNIPNYSRDNIQTPPNYNNNQYLDQYKNNPYRVPTYVMPYPIQNPNDSMINNESMDKTFEETPKRNKKKYREDLLQQIEDKKKRDKDRKRQEEEIDKLYEDKYNKEMEENKKKDNKTTQKKRKRPEDIETNNPPISRKYKPRDYPKDNNSEIEKDYDKFLDKQFKNINYDLSNKIDSELKKLKNAGSSNYIPYNPGMKSQIKNKYPDNQDRDQKQRLYNMIFNDNNPKNHNSSVPKYQPAYFGFNNENIPTIPKGNLDTSSQYIPINHPRNYSLPPSNEMEPMYRTLRELENLNPNDTNRGGKFNPKYKMRDLDIIDPEDVRKYQNYDPNKYKVNLRKEPIPGYDTKHRRKYPEKEKEKEPEDDYPPRKRNKLYMSGPTGKVDEESEPKSKKLSSRNISVHEEEIKNEDVKTPLTRIRPGKETMDMSPEENPHFTRRSSKKSSNKPRNEYPIIPKEEPIENLRTSRQEPLKVNPLKKSIRKEEPESKYNPNDIQPLQKRESVFNKVNKTETEPPKPKRPEKRILEPENNEISVEGYEDVSEDIEQHKLTTFPDQGHIKGIKQEKKNENDKPVEGEEIVFSGIVGGNKENNVHSYHDSSEGQLRVSHKINTIPRKNNNIQNDNKEKNPPNSNKPSEQEFLFDGKNEEQKSENYGYEEPIHYQPEYEYEKYDKKPENDNKQKEIEIEHYEPTFIPEKKTSLKRKKENENAKKQNEIEIEHYEPTFIPTQENKINNTQQNQNEKKPNEIEVSHIEPEYIQPQYNNEKEKNPSINEEKKSEIIDYTEPITTQPQINNKKKNKIPSETIPPKKEEQKEIEIEGYYDNYVDPNQEYEKRIRTPSKIISERDSEEQVYQPEGFLDESANKYKHKVSGRSKKEIIPETYDEAWIINGQGITPIPVDDIDKMSGIIEGQKIDDLISYNDPSENNLKLHNIYTINYSSKEPIEPIEPINIENISYEDPEIQKNMKHYIYAGNTKKNEPLIEQEPINIENISYEDPEIQKNMKHYIYAGNTKKNEPLIEQEPIEPIDIENISYEDPEIQKNMKHYIYGGSKNKLAQPSVISNTSHDSGVIDGINEERLSYNDESIDNKKKHHLNTINYEHIDNEPKVPVEVNEIRYEDTDEPRRHFIVTGKKNKIEPEIDKKELEESYISGIITPKEQIIVQNISYEDDNASMNKKHKVYPLSFKTIEEKTPESINVSYTGSHQSGDIVDDPNPAINQNDFLDKFSDNSNNLKKHKVTGGYVKQEEIPIQSQSYNAGLMGEPDIIDSGIINGGKVEPVEFDKLSYNDSVISERRHKIFKLNKEKNPEPVEFDKLSYNDSVISERKHRITKLNKEKIDPNEIAINITGTINGEGGSYMSYIITPEPIIDIQNISYDDSSVIKGKKHNVPELFIIQPQVPEEQEEEEEEISESSIIKGIKNLEFDDPSFSKKKHKVVTNYDIYEPPIIVEPDILDYDDQSVVSIKKHKISKLNPPNYQEELISEFNLTGTVIGKKEEQNELYYEDLEKKNYKHKISSLSNYQIEGVILGNDPYKEEGIIEGIQLIDQKEILFDDTSIEKGKHKIQGCNPGKNEEPPKPEEPLYYDDSSKIVNKHKINSLNTYTINGLVLGDEPYIETGEIQPVQIIEAPKESLYEDNDNNIKSHKVIAPKKKSEQLNDEVVIEGIIEGINTPDEFYTGLINGYKNDFQIPSLQKNESEHDRSLSQVYIDRTDNLDEHDINLDNIIF